MSRLTGTVPVRGTAIPVLVSFADPGDPATARMVPPEAVEAVLGKGIRLRAISAEVVPNGVWPLDFGGALGEPVTRGIEAKLPWLNGAGRCGGPGAEGGRSADGEGVDSKQAFTRK